MSSALDVKTKIDENTNLTNFSLSMVPTCALLEEIKKREGVETKIAEPYKDLAVNVNGPATVLIVID